MVAGDLIVLLSGKAAARTSHNLPERGDAPRRHYQPNLGTLISAKSLGVFLNVFRRADQDSEKILPKHYL